jgi:hypothetical protein
MSLSLWPSLLNCFFLHKGKICRINQLKREKEPVHHIYMQGYPPKLSKNSFIIKQG